LGDADRPPDVVVVLALDDDADPRGSSGTRVDHADLVVDQVHFLEPRVVPLERLAERTVERVDRPISFAHRVLDDVADLQFDGAFRDGDSAWLARNADVVAKRLEPGAVSAREPLDEEYERRLGRLELVALVLEVLHAVEHLAQKLGVLLEAVLTQLF